MQRLQYQRQKLDFPFAFINIILLLLFFFIVTGSIVGKNETGVAPPVTSRSATERLPRPLLLIDRTGALYLDEVATTLPETISSMRDAAAAAPDDAVTLNIIADRSYPAQRFLDIVEAVRRAGIAVRIVTLDERSGE